MTDTNSDFGSQHTAQQAPAATGPRRSFLQDVPREDAAAATKALHPMMSPEQNLTRIMWTGTIWFVAAVAAVAIALGLLLSSGWRPSSLMGGERVLFWAGSAFVTLSVGLIGWSGCPILEVDVPTSSRNKSLTMQLGTMMFIVGGAATLLAVLLGPAS